jgi:hypothetical protein
MFEKREQRAGMGAWVIGTVPCVTMEILKIYFTNYKIIS